MKFINLIEKYEWIDVARKIMELYPEQIRNLKGYEEAFYELKHPIPVINNDSTIHIEHVGDDDDEYEDVFILNEDDTRYAIDFVAWGEVLGMNIAEEAIEKYPELDIITHVMFEITFYGYSDSDITKKRTELFGVIDSIKKDFGIS